jgi:hypothetical protein
MSTSISSTSAASFSSPFAPGLADDTCRFWPNEDCRLCCRFLGESLLWWTPCSCCCNMVLINSRWILLWINESRSYCCVNDISLSFDQKNFYVKLIRAARCSRFEARKSRFFL